MSRGRNDKTNKVAESKLVLDDEVLFTTFSFDLILAQKQPPEVLLEISQNSQENTCATSGLKTPFIQNTSGLK